MVAAGKGKLDLVAARARPALGTNFVLQSETGDSVGGRVVNNQTCPASCNRKNVSGTGRRWMALPSSVAPSLSLV